MRIKLLNAIKEYQTHFQRSKRVNESSAKNILGTLSVCIVVDVSRTCLPIPLQKRITISSKERIENFGWREKSEKKYIK